MKKYLLLFNVFFCFSAIIYSQPGQLDSSFGANGIVKTNTGSGRDVPSKAKRLMLQLDGSMYILIEAPGEKFGTFIKKIHADGSPDISYGNNGYSKPLPLNPSYCCPVEGGAYAAMQPDGKIVVAGSVNSHLGREVLMVRYNTDGSLDNSFGKKIENFGRDSQVPLSLTILNDGKIILLCETSNYNGNQLVVAYYNQDGSKEQVVMLNLYDFDSPYAFQNDGKMVAALDYNPYAVNRFNIDGSNDTTFSRTEIPSYPSTVAIQSDGKIVVGGPDYISRYNSIGGVDSSFGNNGVITTDYTPGSILFENDGKIVVSVKHNVYDQFFGLVRFNSDGSPDKTLSGDGKLLYNTDLDVDSTYYTNIVIGSNGAISIAGYTDKGGLSRIVAARYNSNGSLDKTFDQDGKLTLALHFSDPTNYTSSVAQADGKIVVAGSEVARYNNDGSPDTGFGKNGKVYSSGWNDIAIETDGKIVVAGSGIARYNTDGRPDVSFGSNGKIMSGDYNSVAVQADGKIVVSGSGIARYNKNGSADLSFGIKGKINSGTTWKDIALQKDGKIVVVGGLYVFEIARFNKDGSIDSTFSEDGYQAIDFAPNDENDEDNYSAEAVAIQEDGRIVVSGQWRYGYRGYGPHITIARYNSDGNLDSTFSGDGELEDYRGSDARSVAIQKDGKIVVGGSVGDLGYDEVYDPSFALARYNNDGTPDERFNNFQQVSISGTIQKVLISDNKLYAVGGGNALGPVGIIARYLLADETKAPAVTLSIPANIVKYSAPARIKLNALVANVSSTITKVRFYSDTTLIHTETVSPYGFLWTDVPAGTYTLTAKAYDENSNIITSNAISVLVADSNVAPVVTIINPMHDTTYTSPATIRLIADAHDANDRISKVEFYNGTTLLRTEYIYPYTYNWMNAQPGKYKITAKAYDARGLSSTSAPVTITINSTTIVSSRLIFGDGKAAINLKLSPNPARNVLQVTTVLSNQDKPTTISIISASGVVAKTIQTSNSNVQIDVSSLTEGVYTVKVVSGDKVTYKQFVKL
ncbi:Ig-like domain-containing protein [Segetibacter koreensis]|uniref:Ig-like domain-containing protein n=1 Tax=Segetibacter koreensis TaxID=398037 RepID=UPI000362BE41|nr:Ig-like domain-containing protein [Segetibacter koreensis]